MTELADSRDRRRALTVLDQTLLVEAAAGTGKTSLLAGRVTMLLADGVAPRNVAAITFTELAAGELRARVHRFVGELLDGTIPVDLALAIPTALTDTQRACLEAARARLDELTATTIHGFCHELLRSYAIEAGVDPGAKILDAVQTDFAFATVFESWLQRRLGENADAADPVAVMARRDPGEAVDTLKKLGKFRREFRTAKPLVHNLSGQAERDFVEAVREFRRWINGVTAPDKALDDVVDLESIATYYESAFEPLPPFARLWELAHPPRNNIMDWRSYNLRPYRRLSIWKGAAGKDEGARLCEQATEHYERCAAAFRHLLGSLATTLVASFSGALDDLLEDFEAFKRHAAVLDFDDLLLSTQALLRTHEPIRQAASDRYTRILVDEFQDTDPVQAEILFRIASTADAASTWQERRLISGRLFLVGDPKQAIYRFRAADIASYMDARNAVERQFPGNILRITTSFRSREGILDYVNRYFEGPLGRQAPGYVALSSSLGPPEHGLTCVMKATIRIGERSKADYIRDQEAQTVAEICASLIGNVRVRRSNREVSLAAPGDIALLAPVGTELWRYERALEEKAIPFVSQAGRNLFRRQETQDFVALVRVLADMRDTLALGALLRGPLVGLTEGELLDITHGLEPRHAGDGHRTGITLLTPLDQVSHPVARDALKVLGDLSRRGLKTTPFLILAEAIDGLHVRAKLAARGSDQSTRALANLDLLMERARRYGVRGLKQLAIDISADWQGGRLGPEPHDEAKLDADGEAINIVTVHSAKGLEWPIVIPINMGSEIRRREPFLHRRRDDTLHWVLGDVVPPAIAEAIGVDDRESAEERERLLYVACTRAMEMLIIPQFSVRRPDNTWTEVLRLAQDEIEEWDGSLFARRATPPTPEQANDQTAEVFLDEQQRVARASSPVRWTRPSDDDPDRRLIEVTRAAGDASEADAPVRVLVAGSSTRGAILHKLIEEVLTGEIAETDSDLVSRATALIGQLSPLADETRPVAAEMAAAVLRTLILPEIVEHRAELTPEVPLYSTEGDTMMAGRADALAFSGGRPAVVFDWKSDVSPAPADRQAYARQLLKYMAASGAPRGAVVYISLGQLEWVEAEGKAV